MVLFRILTNARVNTENQKKKKLTRWAKVVGVEVDKSWIG